MNEFWFREAVEGYKIWFSENIHGQPDEPLLEYSTTDGEYIYLSNGCEKFGKYDIKNSCYIPQHECYWKP